ncbi:MAG: CBS domain-containing protein [Propioniciclava sp.]|uniref:CBS domain-containing protein n=1 Tax=Propioniciclava sp. TaxID=2038686 RepID=UPI0039E3816C
MKLEDVIRSKGTSVVTIAPTASVTELVSLMAEYKIGAVVVSSDGTHIDGIVSERDVVRGLAQNGAAVTESTVADLMTTDVHVGKPEDRIEETAHTMTVKRVRHIPVVVDGNLRAIVSIGDVVKYRIDQLTDERNHLLEYLHT